MYGGIMNENRWIEIQFYFICQDLYSINNEFFDLVDYIQFINNLCKFDINIVTEAAQRVLTFPSHRPTREEIIILGALAGMKMIDIKKYAPIHNRDYYRIIENARKNPPYFYTRLGPEEIEEVKKFVEFHYKIKEVGI